MQHFYFCIVLLDGKSSVILTQNDDIRMLRFHIFSKENNKKKNSAGFAFLSQTWPSHEGCAGAAAGAAQACKDPLDSLPPSSRPALRPCFSACVYSSGDKEGGGGGGGGSDRAVYSSQLEADGTFYNPVSCL